MEHTAKAKDGSEEPKLLRACNLPLAGIGMSLIELADGVSVDEARTKTNVEFEVALGSMPAAA